MHKVLIVEDNENFRKMLELNLKKKGFLIESYGSAEESIQAFNRDVFSVGVFDLKLPEMDGLQLLTKILEYAPDFPVIIITAYGDIETAVSAIKKGAWDFIQKPFDPDHLINRINKAIEERSYTVEKKIVGNSLPLKEAIALVKKVVATDLTVLLYGESGTGKELFARAIHRWSPRKDKPFVVLNSAAIPESLLESELFGIEKGTATGVLKRIGKISQADSGSLFLDEISDMPFLLQSKILRVIEEKTFEKVGGREKISVDARVICATNKDLKKMVDEGEFREDLYYRLNVFPIYLPPLRERKGDIKPLVDYFIDLYGKSVPNKVKGITKRGLLKIKEYEWKGNVRELENVIKRALILCNKDTITEDDIIFQSRKEEGESIGNFDLRKMGEKARIETEIRIIKEALEQTGGNKAEAARLLNISYKTLFNKINEYRII